VRDSHTTGQEAWNIFQTSNCTAYTEFGCASPASVEVLESIIPKDELFPPRRGTAWESHHAFAVWQEESHLYQGMIEQYFGPSKTLAELVENGQLLQAECYKGLFEEVRRQKPHASMALNWCLNEPWPTAANNSVISWPCKPKPALAAIGEALRPVLASARIRAQLWHEGEAFDPELWALSDSPHTTPGATISAYIRLGDKDTHLLDCTFPELAPNTNARGPKLHFVLPRAEVDRFQLQLRVAGRPELDSTYTLAYRPKTVVKQQAVATMNL
jgi:beta-mannosidase